MKPATIILPLCALLLLAACSSHQQRPKMEIPNPEKRLYTLKHRLKLSDEQTAAIRPIIEKEHKDKTALMESFEGGDREAMQQIRKDMENLEWEVIRELAHHLTEEQLDIYSALLEEEKQEMKQQMRAQRGGKRPGGSRR